MSSKIDQLSTEANADSSALTSSALIIPIGKTNQRMITIRVPKSLYADLCTQANLKAVSLNWLCVSKLQQPLIAVALPKEKRRGRIPGKSSYVAIEEVE